MNRALSALMLSILTLAGCSSEPARDPINVPLPNPGALGTEGRVHFNYVPSMECPPDGCSSMKAMMVGTSEVIDIEEQVQSGDIVVTAEDPAVLGVSFEHTEICCRVLRDTSEGGCVSIDVGAECAGDRSHTYNIQVDALSAGQTKLLLKHAADGSLFDSVPLRVAPPATLTLSCEKSDGSAVEVLSSLSVSSSAPCDLLAKASDADGASLQASFGFVIATVNTKIARVDPRFISGGPPRAVNSADATVSAVAPGATQLTVSAGDLKTTIDLTVK